MPAGLVQGPARREVQDWSTWGWQLQAVGALRAGVPLLWTVNNFLQLIVLCIATVGACALGSRAMQAVQCQVLRCPADGLTMKHTWLYEALPCR